MKWLGVFITISVSVCLWAAPGLAWDCDAEGVLCDTVIVESEPFGDDAATETHVLSVPEGTDPEFYLQQLNETGGIAYAEPAMEIQLELSESVPLEPNDPLYREQGHLSGSAGEFIGVDEAWSLLTSSRVIVAVIDSGVDYEHVDLAPNMWVNIGEIPDNGIDDDGNGYVDDVHGYNFFDNDPDPYDDHFHGTHMAGVIGAAGDNGIGITGLLWTTELMALRFTDDDGAGNTAKAVEAIHYAVNNGARVINLSWTIKGSSSSSGSSLERVIQDYSEQGIVFVAASGNGGRSFEGFDIDEDPVYPAAYRSPNLISVGASADNGDLADFSNYGAISVDLLAPGDAILSTFPSDSYGRMSGTSDATAVVSATAAMMLTLTPELSAADVKSILMQTVSYDADLASFVASSGILSIRNALAMALDPSNLDLSENFNSFESHSRAGSGCTLLSGTPSRSSRNSAIFALCFLLLMAMRRVSIQNSSVQK